MLNFKIQNILIIALLLSACLPVAQTQQEIKPYSIETTFEKLQKDFPFISPIKSQATESILKQENIVYKSVLGTDLMLDIYMPKKMDRPLPAVLLVHGGGWLTGSRENLQIMAQDLAKNGFIGISVSYRLGVKAPYPAAVLDIKDAISFIRKRADTLQVDPEKIAILGSSAGAQLATLVGLTPNSEIFKNPNKESSNAVQALINIDGIVSFVHPDAEEGWMAATWLGGDKQHKFDTWKEASPLEYVDSKSPPTLFINSAQPRFHAGRDDMIQLLGQHDIYTEVHTLPDSPHSFWLMHPWYTTTLNLTVDFLNRTFYSDHLYVNAPYREIKVAKDGSGDFTSIQEAINSTRDLGPTEVIINVAKGIYNEKIEIPSWKHQLTINGEDKESTIISNGDYSGMTDAITGKTLSTFTSYTVLVRGNDIKMNNITIENTSCGEGQAVALHVEGDRFIMTNSILKGCQDTLYTATGGSRQYYYNTYIEGTTDFIFGEATVVFQNCEIHSLKNSYITAAATPKSSDFGYVFINCQLTAEASVKEVYLGRPWRPYAKTVFINTNMGAHILPEGWDPWKGDKMFPNKDKTTYYAEYNSRGPGAKVASRVPWSHQLNENDIKRYNLFNIFRGLDYWVPIIPEFNAN